MADGRRAVLRIALVGLGVVAKKHLKAIRYCRRRGEAVLAAVAEPDESAVLLKDRALLGVPRFGSLAALLAEEKIDLVAITTPSGSHYSLAKTALLAGCHVLVEKPLTLNYAEAKELNDLAAKSELTLSVGHIYRYFPFSDELHDAVRTGKLGRLLFGEVTVRWGHDQAYYDSADWRGTYEADGGVLMNQTIHAVDLMQWLIGTDAIEATSLIARQRHEMNAEDLALGIVRFAGDIYLKVEGTTNTDPKRKEASFALFGENGELRASLLAGKVEICLRSNGVKTRGIFRRSFIRLIRQGGFAALFHAGNPHTALYLDVLAAVREGRPAKACGKSGIDALRTVLALYRSAKEGQVVSIPSASAFPLTDMNDYFERLRNRTLEEEAAKKTDADADNIDTDDYGARKQDTKDVDERSCPAGITQAPGDLLPESE